MTNVTVSLVEVEEGYSALSQLMQRAKLPVNQAYWLGRQFKTLREAKELLDKTRLEMIQKYKGVEDEDGVWAVPDDQKREYNAEYREWIKTTMELDFELRPVQFLSDTNIEVEGLAIQLALISFIFTGDNPTDKPKRKRR